MNTPQYIYVMKDLRKVVPPNKEILKGIWLSFYPGAKIGVVGPNESGKSSLLRIMAGVDTNFQGEAWPAKGTRVGYLPQEPQLDERLDVRANVEEEPLLDMVVFDEAHYMRNHETAAYSPALAYRTAPPQSAVTTLTRSPTPAPSS